jgi:hypothetical protein
MTLNQLLKQNLIKINLILKRNLKIEKDPKTSHLRKIKENNYFLRLLSL